MEQAVDGVSLVPVLKGDSIKDRPLFWHYPHYGNQGGEPSSILMEDDWKLIYYHEDQRYELYNITADIAEQDNLLAAQPRRARAMQTRLQQWLRSTPAKFPTKDPQFDAAKREARWEMLGTSGKEKLETLHANYLKADFKPNKDWWGSAVSD